MSSPYLFSIDDLMNDKVLFGEVFEKNKKEDQFGWKNQCQPVQHDGYQPYSCHHCERNHICPKHAGPQPSPNKKGFSNDTPSNTRYGANKKR